MRERPTGAGEAVADTAGALTASRVYLPRGGSNLGLALAQVFQGLARHGRSDAPMPLVFVHVRVRERDPSAGSLVSQVTDDPAIDQRLVEAGGLVLAHLDGGR